MRLARVETAESRVVTIVASATGPFYQLSEVMERIGKATRGVVYDCLEPFIAQCGADPDLLPRVSAIVAVGGWPEVSIERVRWLAPLVEPKIVCIANNNTAFAKDILKGPKNPALFTKPATALIGNHEAIELRADYGVTYPEPELAVVLCRTLKGATPVQGLAAVFGYTVHNDVTSATMREEDTFHFREAVTGATTPYEVKDSYASYPGRYKGSDTFAPMGPWIVTKDEISDPHSLSIECWMETALAYADNTRNLTHYVPDLLSFISRYQTLRSGDVISMGTASDPAGETGDRPQISTDMNKGCRNVTVRIEKIGSLRNVIRVIE